MSGAYYNELEPAAAETLRQLIKAGHIAPGDVDERSIVDVKADDLRGYTQVHLFAGIGIWSAAFRLAGIPDTRPVWSGSCPCQGYSVAGKGKGAGEDRDLWPVFASLIRECRPTAVYGEQVAAAIRFGWLDRLRTDLEKENYAVGSIIAGAHSAGSDNIRQRLWWVANAASERRTTGSVRRRSNATLEGSPEQRKRIGSASKVESGRVADASKQRDDCSKGSARDESKQEPRSGGGFNLWTESRWHQCRDGKSRRVPAVRAIEAESGLQLVADDGAAPCGSLDGGWDGRLFPLAEKTEGRVMILKGAGNAINLGTAAAFIQASEEATTGDPK